VWRQRDPDDARAVRVSLTARARSFRGAAERVLSDLDEQVTAALGARRRDTLTKALKGVMDL
jgi:DNA-binding MarR family transcriptional regulator